MTARLAIAAFLAVGLLVFALGLQAALLLPATLLHAWRKRGVVSRLPTFPGTVTVLVPAFNEEATIRSTVESVLRCRHPATEVLIVDDGSSDGTVAAVRDLVDGCAVRLLAKPNGGKASALNAGIAAARGEVIVCTDADSLFLPETLERLVRWFGDPGIDAVCGNDAPLAPSTPIQKFLAISTHIGTGYVRRGLSALGCLPIISGNLGAFRASVLREVGGYEEIWGEDLELTFRLHAHHRKIVFDSDAKVLAECPGTLRALWTQRVRWVRSYIRIALRYRRLFFRPRFAPFSLYLPVNFVSMTLVPLAQLALVAALPAMISAGAFRFAGAGDAVLYVGFPFFVVIALCSLALDRASSDLRYMPWALLALPLSQFYNLVVAFAWWKEGARAEERWDKIRRRAARPAP